MWSSNISRSPFDPKVLSCLALLLLLIGPTKAQRLLSNESDSSFAPIDAGLTGVEYSSSDWGDFDEDGDLDLIITGTGGLNVGYTTKIYENQNDESFVPVGAGITDVAEGSSDWGDYDNDGDLDLVITGRVSTLSYTAVIYENKGGGEFVPIDADLTSVRNGSSDWGDYDGDGDLDLIITGEGQDSFVPDEMATIYENQGDGEFEPIDAGLTGVTRGSTDWGDYDGDGDLDLIVVGSANTVFNDATIYENQGDGSFVAIESDLTGVKNGSSDWGDYDGDGDLDLIVTGGVGIDSDETATIYENQGGGDFEPIDAGLMGLSLSSSDWGDYDEDGDLDLVVTGVDSNSNTNTIIYENQGGGSFVPADAGLTSVWLGSSNWGDYDRDGDLDLIVTGEDSVGPTVGSPNTTIYENLSKSSPPNPPTGLAATQGDCQISLTWNANTEGDLSGYNLYRSTDPFSDISSAKKINDSLIQDTSYSDSDLENGPYYYRVTAVETAGEESPPSDTVSAQWEVFIAAESEPVLIGGREALQDSIDYPEFAEKAGIEGRVRVQFTVNEAGDTCPPTVTKGVHTLLNNEALETIQRVAVDGPATVRGEPVKFQMSLPVVFSLTTVPTGLTVSQTDNQVSLSWNGDPENELSGFNVYRSTNSFDTTSNAQKINDGLVEDTPYEDSDLKSDTTYYYRLTGVGPDEDESLLSGQVSTTPSQAPPEVPTALQANAGGGQVSLSWDTNSESDLAGYNVYRSSFFFNDPIDETKLNTSLLSDASYSDTDVTSGTTYYYQVTAVDDDGNESNPSNQTSATPSSGPFVDWPDLEDPSITFKVVSPEVNVSKIELVKSGDPKTANVTSGFAKFPDPALLPASEFTQIRLVNASDQVVGYLPFKYEFSNFASGIGIDAVIYVHDEDDLRPDLSTDRWSGEWEYYDEPDVSDPYPLSMLVPPEGDIGKVDLGEKDPVVLVHGVSGSYPSWGGIDKVRELTGHLDGEGYDGWQFYYPENQNITKSGPLLAKAIHRLQNDLGYGPDQSFDLVAHSMGGLVSRHYVQRMGISSSRSTYSEVLDFDPEGPGANVDKFLMLGTPNHGSYAGYRCTDGVGLCTGLDIVGYKDLGAPAFRQMTPGSRFLGDLNRSEGVSDIYSPNLTLVLAGTRNPLERTTLALEIPNQDDGVVAVSSASLLDLEIPLAVGDYTHSGGLDKCCNIVGIDYDPRLNEDTKNIITNFLSDTYDSDSPDSLGEITGFWDETAGGATIPEPYFENGLSINTGEGILTVNAKETSVQSLGITSSCDTDGSSETETCVRIDGGQGMKKVPAQNRFFSHLQGDALSNPLSLGFGAALGLPAKAPRIATVQEHWFGEVGWQPVGKLSLPTKYLHTTQAYLELNDTQRAVAEANGFTPNVGTSSSSDNASATSSKSAALRKAQTAEGEFQVDAETDTLSFWLAQDSTGDFSNHNMRLKAPDGTLIDSSEAKSEPGLGYTQDLALGYAIYSVIDPAPGRWIVRYNASASASVAAPVMSTVDLRASVPDSSFATGETVPVTVSFSGQNTYEDTDVSAQLRVEDPEEGGMTTLGVIDLTESGPTTYEGEFSPSYVGSYQVAVDFSAKVGGESVLRRTVESVTVLGDSTNAAPEPPPPPTSLSAQLEGTDGVALSWSEGDSGEIDGYRIYRDTIPNPAQQVASVPSGQTSYADSEVRGGQVYYYRVAAAGTGGVESDPTDGVSVFTYPSTLSVEVQRTFGSPSSEQGYRLIALPGAADQPLQETLSGEAGSEWQAWWDDGSSQDYFRKFDGSDMFRFRAGRGFWALSKNGWSVSRSVETVPLSSEEQTSIPLHDGWNIIANPFGGDVGWVQVEAANEGTLRTLWRFNGSFAQVDTFRSATAGEAFYFLNDTGLDSLNVPYPGAPAAKSRAKDGEENPLLTIKARPKGAESPTSAVKVGFDEDAARGLGRLDEPAPPGRFSALSLRLQVPGEVPKRQGSLMIERRPMGSGPEEGQTFQLRLRAETDGPVQVTASGLDAAEDSEIRLLRPSAGRNYDLVAEKAITLEEADSTGLKLAVGSPAYVQNQAEKVVPDEITLTSYPNPMRRQATVEYTLPEPTDVRVTVYDMLGRRVAILDEGRKQAGRHMVTLEGEKLPSGVYFGRLEVGDQTRTQKITVVR